jgi:hypothetical protein
MATHHNKRVYNNLCDNLHPHRITGSSDKMYWIMSVILGQEWITRQGSYDQFSITSDGYVIDNDFFLGSADEFERNVRGYVEVAELTPAQTKYFWKLYDMKVTDWREITVK